MRMNNRVLFMSLFIICVAVSSITAQDAELRQQRIIMTDGKEVATNRYVTEDVPDLRQKTVIMADGTEHAIAVYEPIESEQASEHPKPIEIDLRRTDFSGTPQASWVENASGIQGLRFEGPRRKDPAYDDYPKLLVPLATVKSPPIHSQRYVVRARVEYERIDLDYPAYLEMWSYFPDGTKYFTRTLAEYGPMASMVGHSKWRDIELPFDRTGKSTPPSKLVINLVMPGPGEVTIAPTMELEDLAGPARAVATGHIGHYSWADLFKIVAFAVVGGVVAVIVLGLLIAALIAWSARRYRVGWICFMLLGGVMSVLWLPVLFLLPAVGLVEWLIPLLGVVLLIISMRKLHRDRESSNPDDPDEELRKMRAMDVG